MWTADYKPHICSNVSLHNEHQTNSYQQTSYYTEYISSKCSLLKARRWRCKLIHQSWCFPLYRRQILFWDPKSHWPCNEQWKLRFRTYSIIGSRETWLCGVEWMSARYHCCEIGSSVFLNGTFKHRKIAISPKCPSWLLSNYFKAPSPYQTRHQIKN